MSALAAITTQVDNLTYDRASLAATLSSPTVAPSAFFDPNTEEQVRIRIKHRSRSFHSPLLAITDDEMDGEVGVVLSAPRKGQTTSAKLRSADTYAIHQVMWPHELIFTPEGEHAAYESLSIMAFVKGFLTTISLNRMHSG